MQTAFILRKVISARMCLSHSRNSRPPLKFSSRPPALGQAPPACLCFPPLYHCPVHPCDQPCFTRTNHLQLGQNVRKTFLFSNVFLFLICQLQNGKHHLCRVFTRGTRAKEQALTDTQFWSTLFTTNDSFVSCRSLISLPITEKYTLSSGRSQ